MNQVRPGPQSVQSLPTLTEVIELPARTIQAGVEASAPQAPPSAGETLPLDEDLIVQRVLAEIALHADLMLEHRLRESIAPALARFADGLIDDLRQELATTLRDVIARAVNQELARRRDR